VVWQKKKELYKTMTMTHPSLKSVKRKFAKAKAVRCLSKNIVVNVAGLKDFDFNPLLNTWTSKGGAVTFWNENEGYAEIVAVCKCSSCKCNDNEKKSKA
jgi:hypothetical protein